MKTKRSYLFITILFVLLVVVGLLLGKFFFEIAYDEISEKIFFMNRILGDKNPTEFYHYHRDFVRVLIPLFWSAYLLSLVRIYIVRNAKQYSRKKSSKNYSNIFLFFLLTIMGSMALLWTALWNKYPLVYPDTVGYFTGGELMRSVGYHLFVVATRFGISAWLTIFAQSLITSFLLMKTSCIMLQNIKYKYFIAFMVLISVILLTDISKYTCWLIPDIFSSWLFLGGTIFFLSSTWQEKIYGIAAIGFSLFCHASNILIVSLSLLALCMVGVVCKLRFPDILRKTKELTISVFLICVSVTVVNYSSNHGLTLFPTIKSPFLMAKLISYGMVSDVLDEHCEVEKWGFCKYKNDLKLLVGEHHNFILWSPKSPYAKLIDIKNERDAGEIIFHALKSNFSKIVKYSLLDTYELMRKVNSKDELTRGKFKTYLRFIKIHKEKYPLEYKHSLKSKQGLKPLFKVRIFRFNDVVFQISVVMFTFLVAIACLFKRNYRLLIFIVCTVVFILFNDLLTASISGPVTRYNMRVLWLLPYSLILTLCIFIDKNIISIKRGYSRKK